VREKNNKTNSSSRKDGESLGEREREDVAYICVLFVHCSLAVFSHFSAPLSLCWILSAPPPSPLSLSLFNYQSSLALARAMQLSPTHQNLLPSED
jgi:hypothetical protein